MQKNASEREVVMERKRYSAEFKYKAVKLYHKGKTFGEVSQCFGVPSKTLYAWIRRYQEKGYKGLEDKKGGWKQNRKKEKEAVVRRVIEVKEQNPGMGSKRISGHLARFNLLKVCGSTVSKILNRHAEEIKGTSSQSTDIPPEAEVQGRRLRPRKKARKINKPKQVRFFERASPNDLWQMDIMTFMLKGMYRIYLIGVIDDYSRYIVSHGLYRRQTENNVHEVLRSGIEKHGCPKEVLTDNGRQFYSWRGKSKFTKFCIKTGIQHIRSRPYHPQTLGKIESFWRNLYQEFLGEVPLSSFEEAQEKIAKWIKYYNHERVHLGIGGQLVPADRYFGVSRQVEQLIKEGTEETEKELAKNPLSLKPPMYLVGKIGDKEIRLLAKDGEVTIKGGQEKPVECTEKNMVESGREETGIAAGREEIHTDGKDGVDGEQGVAVSSPAPENTPTGQAVANFEEESDDGRTEGAGKTAGEGATMAGTTAGGGMPCAECVNGGQVSPADKQPGEDGADTVSIEEGKDGWADMPGDEPEQGSVLQMDEGSDGRDEGVAGTGGPWQKSVGGPAEETGAPAAGERKQGIAEGTGESGSAGENTAAPDRVAEAG